MMHLFAYSSSLFEDVGLREQWFCCALLPVNLASCIFCVILLLTLSSLPCRLCFSSSSAVMSLELMFESLEEILRYDCTLLADAHCERQDRSLAWPLTLPGFGMFLLEPSQDIISSISFIRNMLFASLPLLFLFAILTSRGVGVPSPKIGLALIFLNPPIAWKSLIIL